MSTSKPNWTSEDHKTWRTLFQAQDPLRDQQIIPTFSQGLRELNIGSAQIPDLVDVNQRLKKKTGWEGVYVNGFEGPQTFFHMLANKKFPVGQFIRDAKDLSYTPEPDVFHDLYGHLPFYIDQDYADFSYEFGRRAIKYLDSEKITEEFQRFFWFTVEFGLVKTMAGLRIFGAGIASSFGECAYSLSQQPKKLPFDLEVIRAKPFRIDIMQNELFVFENVHELYKSLDQFERAYRNDKFA